MEFRGFEAAFEDNGAICFHSSVNAHLLVFGVNYGVPFDLEVTVNVTESGLRSAGNRYVGRAYSLLLA